MNKKKKMVCITSDYGPAWENKQVEAKLMGEEMPGFAWCKIGILHRFIPVEYLQNQETDV